MNSSGITIIGLGLIGGSLAKAFRRTNPNFTIKGVDTNRDNLRMALEEGSIDLAAERMEEMIPGSGVVFLCTPVSRIPGLLKTLSRTAEPGTIITDAGSIKSGIMKAAEQALPNDVFFIGGHPMAGAERSGYSAGIPHLFENAYYILTPLPDTPPWAVKHLENLIASTGALPLVLDPLTHDRSVGAVSHLPHIVAAALVHAVRMADDPEHLIKKLAAGGFKDITRIASSNPKMWQDICLSNKEQILPLLSNTIRILHEFGKSLEQNKDEDILAFYEQAKTFRDQIPSSDILYLLPYYQVYVDVEDRPGIIGQVATILGNQNVNIKNIRIINSREDEPGCLVLSLDSKEAREKAVALLNQAGCRAYTKE